MEGSESYCEGATYAQGYVPTWARGERELCALAIPTFPLSFSTVPPAKACLLAKLQEEVKPGMGWSTCTVLSAVGLTHHLPDSLFPDPP